MINNNILACPCCKQSLDDQYYCKACDIKYPTVQNKPVLINEKNSIFSFSDYNEDDAYSFFGKANKLGSILKLVPSIDFNYAARKNFDHLSQLLLAQSDKPTVLVIGGGVVGDGMSKLMNTPNITIINTDVSYTELNQIICDGHDLPFKDGSFHAVVIQAVLEHVADPYRCAEEIHRVLKEGGIVYAETPFMQQGHGGAYDFTRFTWLGHRRLFRKFEEIDSGTCCGPGMALSWSWNYFLRSFVRGRVIEKLTQIFARFTSFFWKYFDRILKNNVNTLEAASGNYFIGKKTTGYILSDKDLVGLYNRKKKLTPTPKI